MADEKQLEILKQGFRVWNEWRDDNPDVVIDLSGADLGDADLGSPGFFDGDLTSNCANLSHANLSRAVLRNANLSDANLRNANHILFNGHEGLWGSNSIYHFCFWAGKDLVRW